jgi:hypothetical protein
VRSAEFRTKALAANGMKDSGGQDPSDDLTEHSYVFAELSPRCFLTQAFSYPSKMFFFVRKRFMWIWAKHRVIALSNS